MNEATSILTLYTHTHTPHTTHTHTHTTHTQTTHTHTHILTYVNSKLESVSAVEQISGF